MSRIFISYRREDSSQQAQRIYSWLKAKLGAGTVFMDVEDRPREQFRPIHQPGNWIGKFVARDHRNKMVKLLGFGRPPALG